MRRAAVQIFRTARRSALPRVGRGQGISAAKPSPFGSRYRKGDGGSALSSMYIRNFSVALISTLFASGAYYAYRGSPQSEKDGSVSQSGPGDSPGFATSANVYSTSPAAGQNSVTAEEAAESTRRAVVVESDQFYTGSIVGDEPLSKYTDDAGRKVLEMLTPDQATSKLRRNEKSYLVGRGNGVVRYDYVQIPSNDPIEDDHVEKLIDVPFTVAAPEDGKSSTDWMFWGVFDGHSGWTTSAKLRQVLISFVARELRTAYTSALSDPKRTIPTPEAIDSAIKQGFLKLDHEIIHESVEKVMKANSKGMAAELLAPAMSGSCALLSFYDSRSKTLRVACTGDSRAVLGRKGPNGKWNAIPLSVDQTGGSESEAERLRREHPDEPNVVRNGRILGGLEPSRAFGDAFYKWTQETQMKIKRSFFGRTPSPLLKTPPYVTAEPIITTTKVEPTKGDFLVMATDGLWEMLTNEEAIGLVGQWLESQAAGSKSNGAGSSWLNLFSSQSKGLPVENKGSGGDNSGQRAPIRIQQWGVNAPERERFVCEDKNAATHLVRNALGGKDRDMVCALLTLPSPYSRRYRDDLTVEVIFFGEGDKSGNVEPNKEASSSVLDVKAKL